MKPTERLYYTGSLLDFSALVLEVTPTDRGDCVVLDQTAFYPTGGGQPNDTGTLGEAEVIDVMENEAGLIRHIVKQRGLVAQGQTVRGHIDPARRLDHLQQHSGQHILSQAFVQACGAETRSFHLGAESCTIDIELQSPTIDHLRRAEDIANRVVFENRPMRVHIVNEDQAAALPLRKESAVRGSIRVIEVEDFDWSPCGGTHAERTGQVGLIAIKSFERAKKMTRVEFVCGLRALADYRRANGVAVAVARSFSADRDAAPELVAKALEENKTLKKRARELLQLAVIAEASAALSESVDHGDFKLVESVFDGKDAEELRLLASKIVETDSAVALLGSRDNGAARLVFARSKTIRPDLNMGELLREACECVGGRGGGQAEMAQGGGQAVENLDRAVRAAADKVRSLNR